MAYPRPFIKFSFGGTLFGSEEWTSSLNLYYNNLIPGDVNAGDVTENLLSSLTDDLITYWTGVADQVNQYTTLDWSKIAPIGTDGKYIGAPASMPISDQRGTNTVITLPAQCSLVLSMQSDAWGARGKNGRIYQPGPAVSVEADGRIYGPHRDDFLDNFEDFINNINSTLNGFTSSGAVVIASSVGEGALNPVTKVRVGRVVDTQRSRRTSLEEDYSERDISVTLIGGTDGV